MSVLLQTTLGNIVIDLSVKEAPLESKNFIKLCKAKYYNFAPLFNIQKDYLVESGAPLYPQTLEGCSAWGLVNSEAKMFNTSKNNKLKKNSLGEVSFLTQKSGTNNNDYSATSLFAILLNDLEGPQMSLKNNVVFGKVVEGLDVLDKINNAFVDEDYRPLQDIRIHHTYILDDPFEDIPGLDLPPGSPEISYQQLSTVRLEDFNLVNPDDLEKEVAPEELKARREQEANSKALTLEIIGDLPSAEMKPMENVLFVCKLNPLTTDDDLEVIFSRFGKILTCEIIRDQDTGDSLQYAFIEYQDKKSCEAAYFKMDQVLIDDRRIHVDFSQSVSRLSETWRVNTLQRKQKDYEMQSIHQAQKYLKSKVNRDDYRGRDDCREASKNWKRCNNKNRSPETSEHGKHSGRTTKDYRQRGSFRPGYR